MTRLVARLRTRFPSGFELDVDLDLSWPAAAHAGAGPAGDAQIVALFGPSGCGKSTTLLSIAGLLDGVTGRIELDGRVLLDSAAHFALPPEERTVALVPQDALLFPHLSVDGNLAFGARRARGRTAPDRAQVIDMLGLAALLKRMPDTLSGGERQRVAVARALLAAPSLLLLDEPVSALDHTARWQVLELIERVVSDLRVPALYVSHNQSEVLRLCSTAARLDAGRVVAVGPADEVLADAAPRQGEAVWNVVRVEADAAGVPCLGGGARIVIPHELTPGEAVWCRISSAAIALRPPLPAAAAPAPTSARNHIPARVLAITTLGDRERVTVDAGVALHIDITPEARAELELAPGRDVVCTFKTYAVELLG